MWKLIEGKFAKVWLEFYEIKLVTLFGGSLGILICTHLKEKERSLRDPGSQKFPAAEGFHPNPILFAILSIPRQILL